MKELSIIPKPKSVAMKSGTFSITPETRIFAHPAAANAAGKLCAWIKLYSGITSLEKPAEKLPKNTIAFEVDESQAIGPEGYRLSVTKEQIRLTASTNSGFIYAAQTLRQLLPASVYAAGHSDSVQLTVPCVDITDAPRFAWRGAMLDVARHFMPLPFIFKFIDLLALHKLNSFHWHLTEDQGWRIEIKKYPRLNEIGSFRDETMIGHYRENETGPQYDGIRHGGFYTQDEVKQVVAYASSLGVNVVPEIEMPGHAQAAIASYPELGNTDEVIKVSQGWGIHEHVFNVEESTFTFLQDVLDEVLAVFPSKFIHIGGDEVPKKEWKENPKAQQKMKELGLRDEEELQSYFITRIDRFLTQRNRRMIGWDEILEGGLAPNATVMSWRGESGGIAAVKAGHDVVMAPNTYTYFDYYQSRDRDSEPLAIGGFLPLEVVYGYDPVPAEIDPSGVHHILGTQAQIWTEYIPEPDKVEFMAYPRLCALAEVAWSDKSQKDYSNFLQRLENHLECLSFIPVNYRKLDLD